MPSLKSLALTALRTTLLAALEAIESSSAPRSIFNMNMRQSSQHSSHGRPMSASQTFVNVLGGSSNRSGCLSRAAISNPPTPPPPSVSPVNQTDLAQAHYAESKIWHEREVSHSPERHELQAAPRLPSERDNGGEATRVQAWTEHLGRLAHAFSRSGHLQRNSFDATPAPVDTKGGATVAQQSGTPAAPDTLSRVSAPSAADSMAAHAAMRASLASRRRSQGAQCSIDDSTQAGVITIAGSIAPTQEKPPLCDMQMIAASLEAAHEAVQQSRELQQGLSASQRSDVAVLPERQLSGSFHPHDISHSAQGTQQQSGAGTHSTSLSMGDDGACPVCLSNQARVMVRACEHRMCCTCLRAICSAGNQVPKCPLCRAHMDALLACA